MPVSLRAGLLIPLKLAADLRHTEPMKDEDRQALVLWRLSILGPLISARLQHGDRQAYFDLAPRRVHERPDGALVRVSARTIETWYRTYRRDGFAGLMPKGRADSGQSRVLNSEVVDLVLRAKREQPRRSIRRIIAMLERAEKGQPGDLKRSSVHRVLQAAGLSGRPRREGAAAERRSFLWSGPATCGSRTRCMGLYRRFAADDLRGARRAFAAHGRARR